MALTTSRRTTGPVPTPVRRPARTLAVVAAACGLGFAGSTVLAGTLDPGYSQTGEGISALASTQSQAPGVMTAGFLLLAAGLVAAGGALWSSMPARAARVGSALVVLAGAATVVVAFARQSCSTLQQACLDRESAGAVSDAHVVHNLVALGSFVLLVVAGFLLAAGVRRDARLRRWTTPLRVAALCSVGLFVWFGSGAYGDLGGVVQRAFVLVAYGLPVGLALVATGTASRRAGSLS